MTYPSVESSLQRISLAIMGLIDSEGLRRRDFFSCKYGADEGVFRKNFCEIRLMDSFLGYRFFNLSRARGSALLTVRQKQAYWVFFHINPSISLTIFDI